MEGQTHQLVIQKGTGLLERIGSAARFQNGTAAVHRERFFNEVQRHGVGKNAVKTAVIPPGTTAVIAQKKGTVRLLRRPEIAVKRVMQKLPPRVYEVARSRQQ